MSKLELIRALYEYNEWANNRVLKAASKLTDEEFAGAQGASFDSVQGNLGHVVAAQMAWLERWTRGANSTPTTQLASIRGREGVGAAYEESHAALREFLSSLTEERLESALSYRNSTGIAFERVLWQLMTHVANHGSYHRGETSMALTAMGHNPGDLDYLYFEMGRAG
jgi:uncharacterized damage-inducible protein DinB